MFLYLHCRPFHWNIFLWRYVFTFTICKMDCIGCNWFRNICPPLVEVVWVDFGKEMPYAYISCSFEWADALKFEMVVQPKRGKGLDSLESRQLKRRSGLDFAKFKQCHVIFQMKYCNSLLGSLVKGANSLILLGLRVSHKVPLARSRRGRRDFLIKGLFAIAKGFSHNGKTDTCWGCWLVM